MINLSLALAQPSINGIRALEEAFDQAVRRGVIVVAAAGNQGALGSSAITRHPWVIPVVACDDRGRPMNDSNLGGSIGRRGLSAPGAGVTSLAAEGEPLTLGGTSVAAPFVTGAIALLWSEFSGASAGQIKLAVTQASLRRRASVVPPLLDAEAAYRALSIESWAEGHCMTKEIDDRKPYRRRQTPAVSRAPARVCDRRGDRAWRRDKARRFLFRRATLRRLRTAPRRAQSLADIRQRATRDKKITCSSVD